MKRRRNAQRRRSWPLSERRRVFVESFMGEARGNATRAALAAGYSKATARQQGSRLLTFVDVQQAIAERAKNDPRVWAREDLQRFWTAVASGAGRYARTSIRHRLKASELLGRSQGDFVERIDHRGATLEELLAEAGSRRPDDNAYPPRDGAWSSSTPESDR